MNVDMKKKYIIETRILFAHEFFFICSIGIGLASLYEENNNKKREMTLVEFCFDS